ncbi:MAG: hypothetical protein ACFHVJ_01685 [Aestuariibacter sp.]
MKKLAAIVFGASLALSGAANAGEKAGTQGGFQSQGFFMSIFCSLLCERPQCVIGGSEDKHCMSTR